MGPSSKLVDHNRYTAIVIAHGQVRLVKPHSVPRSEWNTKRVKSRSHMGLNLSSSTHDASLTKIIQILANSFPTKYVERFNKSAINSFMIN
jgi:hypothetical protein